jgi:hypothetical protein
MQNNTNLHQGRIVEIQTKSTSSNTSTTIFCQRIVQKNYDIIWEFFPNGGQICHQKQVNHDTNIKLQNSAI